MKSTTYTYLIGMGANLGDLQSNFDLAEREIARAIGQILSRSARIETEPMLDPKNPVLGQSNYLNSGIQVASELSPHKVLQQLQRIEEDLGRESASERIHWGPRVIDLDLLACGDLILETDSLTLPHPGIPFREFVLIPLMEISPDWLHPILGKCPGEMIEDLKTSRCSAALADYSLYV